MSTLILAVFLQLAAALVPPPADVRALAISTPASLASVDLDRIEGRPTRLVWSPDGLQLYLRTTVADRWGNERSLHHLVDLASRRLSTVSVEPAWAPAAWYAKAALEAPGVPGFRVEVESREERVTATGVAGAGAMAGNASDPSLGAALGPQGAAIVSSVIQAQKVTRTTLKLKGEQVGVFVNTPAEPGLTFGWAPPGSGLVAFVDAKGRLSLMDLTGRKRQLQGVKQALLPAWTADGRRLACLDRSGKKKHEVKVFELGKR